MDRNSLLSRLAESQTSGWDIAIIGGGAVGLGTALDAASRGHSCVLFEQHDYCKGTSSRSTKLIHGGVRYLAQGNVSLVREALHERERLFRNAPTLVHPLRFVIPCYSAWERWYYWTGLKCYDGLAGRLGIRASRAMNTDEVSKSLPGLEAEKLHGGVAYFDAQFDDARLGVAVAKKCYELGALPLNYMRVQGFIKDSQQRIEGVNVVDEETGTTFDVHAKTVINATGAFSDAIRQLEDPDLPDTIAPSQGIHLVVDQRFLGGSDALMIPKTSDNRVLFAIPWLGRAILGTTDTPVPTSSLEPKPLEQEVDYLLKHFAPYLRSSLSRSDVLSVFAGLRPLIKPSSGAGETSKISREHRVLRSSGGLISILGGKWTTFRKMAEDVVDEAEIAGQLRKAPCGTENLSLEADAGSNAATPDSGPDREQVERAVRQEFARTVEDVLARRFRCLFLDAQNSIDLAPQVATWIAETLGHPPGWADQQVREYQQAAEGYLIGRR